ncbi:MAG: glycosyltransferase family 2 protein [Candidatus Omnitrophica bacterium]|nr:glycosyltransferase family 2 protein [Candidatus Omnitrophota bacterium]
MAASSLRLSVIIPAYNEERRLGATLDEVGSYLGRQPYPAEVLVVDDGSTDGTVSVAQQHASALPRFRLLRNPHNLGKGGAVRHGVMASQGGQVLLYDADGSTPIEELERCWPYAAAGTFVVGTRKAAGARILKRQAPLREWMGKGFTYLSNRWLGLRISDVTCGFKLLERQAAHAVCRLQRLNRWAYDAELFFLAKRLGIRVREVPIQWADSAQTRVRLGSDTVSSFVELLQIRWNALRGVYRDT